MIRSYLPLFFLAVGQNLSAGLDSTVRGVNVPNVVETRVYYGPLFYLGVHNPSDTPIEYNDDKMLILVTKWQNVVNVRAYAAIPLYLALIALLSAKVYRKKVSLVWDLILRGVLLYANIAREPSRKSGAVFYDVPLIAVVTTLCNLLENRFRHKIGWKVRFRYTDLVLFFGLLIDSAMLGSFGRRQVQKNRAS